MRASTTDHDVVAWRCGRLRRAGFPAELAQRLAEDRRMDLHALIELVERGCPAPLAVRILTPMDENGDTA
jgi:hypothetical protein